MKPESGKAGPYGLTQTLRVERSNQCFHLSRTWGMLRGRAAALQSRRRKRPDLGIDAMEPK